MTIKAFNKLVFLVAAFTSLAGSVVALATPVLPKWALFLFMISALAFLATFTSVILMEHGPGRLGPGLPRTSIFAIVLFCAGSFGAFLASLEAYLMDPAQPFLAFLRLNLASSVLLVVGTFGLMYDAILLRVPKATAFLYFFITLGAWALFASSLLAYLFQERAYEIVSLVGAILFSGIAIFNLFT